MAWFEKRIMFKKHEVVLFSFTAIALYSYDQGIMSPINTNYSYLDTIGITEGDPLVGVIVSVYYLGCAIGPVTTSWDSDKKSHKPSIFACLAVTSLGNILMLFAGLGFCRGAFIVFFLGRVIWGLELDGLMQLSCLFIRAGFG